MLPSSGACRLPRTPRTSSRSREHGTRPRSDRDHVMDVPHSQTLPADRAEAIRAWFRRDPSGMTMMAARKFGVPEQDVVEALIGQAPIDRLRAGSFPEVMD